MPQPCIAYRFLYACHSSDAELNVAKHFPSAGTKYVQQIKTMHWGLVLVWMVALSQYQADGRISTLQSSKCMCY